MRSRWFVVISLCLTATLGACKSKETQDIYETFTAGVGDVRDVIQATGTLEAKGAIDIRANARGVVETVLVKEGDTVRAGQVLARMRSATRTPAIQQAKARQEANRSTIDETRARLATAQEKLNRVTHLHASGFVSPAAVDTARAEFAAANASVDRAMNEHLATTAEVRLAEAQAQEGDIIAPLDGRVTLVSIQSGQTISPDDKIPHFQTLQNAEEMVLKILVAEADADRVKEASQIYFTVDARPNIQEMAQFVSMGEAPIRDGNFVSYLLTAEYKNPFGITRPGMSASVQIFQADARSVLRVPRQATHFLPHDYIPPIPAEKLEKLKVKYHGDMRSVRAGATGVEARYMIDNKRRRVFVLVDGKPVRREITYGSMTDEFIEVLSGIEEGETVIVKDNRDPRRGI